MNNQYQSTVIKIEQNTARGSTYTKIVTRMLLIVRICAACILRILLGLFRYIETDFSNKSDYQQFSKKTKSAINPSLSAQSATSAFLFPNRYSLKQTIKSESYFLWFSRYLVGLSPNCLVKVRVKLVGCE